MVVFIFLFNIYGVCMADVCKYTFMRSSAFVVVISLLSSSAASEVQRGLKSSGDLSQSSQSQCR